MTRKDMRIQTWIDENENWVVGLVALAALLYVWPNLVHEPLHWVVLKLTGAEGTIHFDWTSWPAAPYTAHAGVTSLVQGLTYRLLPSIASIAILLLLWHTRAKAALLTHITLPLYLTFDLIVNILGRASPGNDFHFLTALNPMWTYIPVVAIMWLGYKVISAGIEDEVKEYQQKKRKLLEVASEQRHA